MVGDAMTKSSMQSKGGAARAAKLSPEDRKAIAVEAAKKRWAKEAEKNPDRPAFPRATHTGEIDLGGFKIECAVLEDGTRVLSRAGFVQAMGRTGKVKGGEAYAPESKLPVFLGAENLQPFIGAELRENSNCVNYRHQTSGKVCMGYQADFLREVCDLFLEARKAGALKANQTHIAHQCEVLMRAFAKVGLAALVDEATGYQEIRDKKALQGILDKFIAKELAAWAKRFPDDFYKEMFRLRNWNWQGMKVNRPSCVGTYTNNLIYERLAPGVLAELERINPVTESGYRRHNHHQWLTDDVGHVALSQHMHTTIAFMRASTTWEGFLKLMDSALPKRNAQLPLLIEE